MNSLPSISFSHLNLRRNPFGDFSADEQTQLASVNLDSALEHLRSRSHIHSPALQIIGEKGYGKTTHLLSLATHFPEAVYVHIPEGEYAAIPAEGNPLLVDEAQRLTLWQRFQIFRSSRMLVLGTHHDFRQHLKWAGRSVLTLEAARHTTPKLIEKILNDRIRSVRRSSDSIPVVTQATAEKLFVMFGHDLRSLQNHLYEVFQNLGSVQDV